MWVLAVLITACLALDRKEQLKKIWKHPDFKSFDHFWNASYGHETLMDVDKTWMMMWMLEERMICILEDICPTPRKSIINNPVACVDGFVSANGVQYPCDKVSLESFVSLIDLGSGPTADGNDIWGYKDDAGNRYVISGQTDGASIIDITDPTNPDVLVFIPSTTYPANILWRDMKITENHYLYIVADGAGHGLQSMALDPLIAKGRNSAGIYVASRITEENPNGDFLTSAAIGNSHNIVSLPSKNVVYSVGSRNDQGSSGGIIRYTTGETSGIPAVSGVYSGASYTHDAECIVYNGPDTEYQGKEVCFGYQGGNPNELAIVYWDEETDEFVEISKTTYDFASYTHQGWITEDHRFLLMNDEADESRNGFNTRTIIVKLDNDLSAPTYTFYSGETPAIDHNLYIVGDYVYEANYKAGLRVIKLSEETEGVLELDEVASFQTWTQGPINAAFNGAWSSYPFWVKEDCIVAVQDIEQGLFILKVDSSLGICAPSTE